MDQERSDLNSGSVGESAGIEAVFVFNCPYLGMLEDSMTSLAYPASANHCFREESPIGVDLAHQEEYCLTERHPGCHVFQMASAVTADAKPVAPLTEPEKRKQRVTLYAFPLILILILLAAIIWWPAPGKTIQDSLVLGAQNDREASGGATLNGKPDSQPAVAEKAVEVASPDAIGEPATTVSLNESGDQAEQEGAVTSTKESARNSAADNGQIQASSGTGMAPAQSTEVEAPVETQISSEEISSVNSEQDIPTETSEASPESTSSIEESPSSSAEVAVSDDASEETGPKTVTEEASAAIDEDTDKSLAVVITDLPVISSDILALTTYPVIKSAFVATGALNIRSGPGIEYEAISVISSGELVGLIGRHELGPWVRVRLDSGLEGWVNSMLLAKVS